MSSMPLWTSKRPNSSKARFHSASVLSVIWMPGSMRQKRSGQTATKPWVASQSQVSRMTWFTPKISWATTMPGAGVTSGTAA